MTDKDGQEDSDAQLVEAFVSRVIAMRREADEAKAEARRIFQTDLIFLEFALSFAEDLTGTSSDSTFEQLDHSFIEDIQTLLKVPTEWVTTLSRPNNHILITSPEGDATVSVLVIERDGAQSSLIHTYRGLPDEANFMTLYSPPLKETNAAAAARTVEEFISSVGN